MMILICAIGQKSAIFSYTTVAIIQHITCNKINITKKKKKKKNEEKEAEEEGGEKQLTTTIYLSHWRIESPHAIKA